MSEERLEAAPVTPIWKLFTAFMRVGAFTFGGGYAMLPMLERECVERRAGSRMTSCSIILR